jgi:hypothetical protein
MMDILTAEDIMDKTVQAIKLGWEHFDLPCLATLIATNKCWKAKILAALDEAAPAAAQQLLLDSAGCKNPWVPPVAAVQPLLKTLIKRASSIADAGALECFTRALATKVVSQPGITKSQARTWLSAGLLLTDAIIYAAARVPLARPALWLQCHLQVRLFLRGGRLSSYLQALCDVDYTVVSLSLAK